MSTLKNKHLSYEDRISIQEYLNNHFSIASIARILNKSHSTIAREIYKHRIYRTNGASDNSSCPTILKSPHVCNGCAFKPVCKKIKYSYDATSAHNDYLNTLVNIRSNLFITKDQIASINEIIVPLMINKHHSVNQVFINHKDILPFSKSSFYKYIDFGILNIKNIDLHRKVRFKVKKEYNYDKRFLNNPKIKLHRFYRDFIDYITFNPDASIVEMDTVIGTSGGKGGKCFLTLLFRKYRFMLIYLLPYKQSKYVSYVFHKLKKQLGSDEFKRLFEVVLTDNGTEFSDPESIEIDPATGEVLSQVFYCDPNCSWQKGSIEKNHEYIRYILPKGSSFAGLTQQDCYLLASHINSIPREILNNLSPFKAAINFIGDNNMKVFNISFIDYDDVNCSPSLLIK